MRIDLDGLAAVRHASIEIDAITVIAGENDTGKSTVSKALWCMFDSFYKYEEQLESYREETLQAAINSVVGSGLRPYAFRAALRDIAREVASSLDAIRADSAVVDRIFESNLASLGSGELPPDSSRSDLSLLRDDILRIVSYDDGLLMRGVMTGNFLSEFSGQPSNVDVEGSGASVSLVIKDRPSVATIVDNEVTDISSIKHLDVRAIYIDDSFILDEVAYPRARPLFNEDRHDRLRRLLSSQKRADGNVLSEMIARDRVAEALAQINVAMPGDLRRESRRSLVYQPVGYDHSVSARNLSAGMKTFAILKMLLENGSLEQRSTLILDEPEVHLHPEWQLVLAEAIVMLQRAFGLHVLITTHSPYFLRAIQVYAAKHSMATHCRYYLAEREGKWCRATDVTEHTEVIFDRLVRPFERLDEEMAAL